MEESGGYVKINNDLMDWLLLQSSALTKREYSVLWCVVRYTVGFRRSTAALSARYICNSLGLDPRSHAGVTLQALRSLEEKGFVALASKSGITEVTLLGPKSDGEQEKPVKTAELTETPVWMI